MDKLKLDLLHEQKRIIGQRMLNKGKYAMNDLTRSVNETLSTLSNMSVPESLEADKSVAVTMIRQAKTVIDKEYSNLKLGPDGYEKISTEAQSQAESIRDALREFDSKGLAWLNSDQIN